MLDTSTSCTWTIAVRTPGQRKFRRVTDWVGTWQQAYDLSTRVCAVHPDMSVWYVSSADAETAGLVCAEDIGNILMDGTFTRKGAWRPGPRVPIIERGSILDLI